MSQSHNTTTTANNDPTTNGASGADLTKFQLHILGILAEDSRYGLAVKRELEAYYGEEVNHGRLYPNLDDLVDAGLVEKSALDRRTNQYELTVRGEGVLVDEVFWLAERLDMTSVVEEVIGDGS